MTDDKSLPDPARGPAEDVPTFLELIEGERTALLTTTDRDGTIITRPMAVQAVDDDATIWFMAYSDSPKIEQLTARPSVNVSFVGDGTWVSASGTGYVVDDDAKKKELWNPFAEAWFQCEPTDTRVALIRVDVTGGEYWDSPSKPAQLFSTVKALIGHDRPDDGENAKLDLA